MGVQLVGLLLLCLIAAEAISFGLILLMPPPRPPVYRVSEIATALQGGSLSARAGRPMRRTFAWDLPDDAHGPAHPGPALGELAAALRLRPQEVRLVVRRPLFGPHHWHGRRFPPRRPPDGPPPRRGEFGAFDGPPSDRPPPFRNEPIIGEFTAAAVAPAGGWVVVRSPPEPFPSVWQAQALAWLLAGFAVVAPAGLLFARRITAPLKRFSEAAEQLGRDPHAPQLKLSGPAEIGAAAEAFNEMQARLQRYINDRTAMVGAISHDLRTPLARIRFKIEAADPELKTAELSDVAQMEQMLQGVLAFIRNEGAPRRRERFDLLSMAECVADDAALVGGKVEIAPGEPVIVEGDPTALQRLLSNLVDNAVKYGGEARIEVRREGGGAVVEVADHGPGLAEADLERVFEPFYRVDAARNVDAGGIGLGLPIARSTARAHGGDVQLVSTGDGLCARLTLPVSD